MKICLSKYYRPFVEPSLPGVHFISKDDQIDMRLGFYDAHVREYKKLPTSIVDPLTGRTYFCDPSKPSRTTTPLNHKSDTTLEFLHDLYFNSGVKAASRVLGRGGLIKHRLSEKQKSENRRRNAENRSKANL